MNVKRVKLFGLMQAFDSVRDLAGVKFSYAIAKNRRKIDAEIKSLNDSITPSNEYQKFEKERVALCIKYCEKDKQDHPVVENNSYAGLTDNTSFQESLKQLREDNKEVLDARELQVEEYNSLINEEIEIEFHKVLISDVPENITVSQLDALMLIIANDEEEKKKVNE